MTHLYNADKGQRCPNVVRFPMRRSSAVFIVPEHLGGYYTIYGARGWLFPSLGEALAEAHTIGSRLGVPVRMGALQ